MSPLTAQPAASTNEVVFPGDSICNADESIIPGDGTYVLSGHIKSSLIGKVYVTRSKVPKKCSENDEPSEEKKPIVSVVPIMPIKHLLNVGDIACCKVVGFGEQSVNCLIFSVNNRRTSDEFRAVLRREDVRTYGKDTVNLYEHFQINDIILARIICLGDFDGYFLSTAEPELGVVVAYCKDGHLLSALSHETMKCDESGRIEKRKVARLHDSCLVFV